jgi:hypothetical protein
MSVREDTSGVITLRWDITQSRMPIFRPQNTVNGKLVIHPKTSTRAAYLEYWGDGFPSVGLRYVDEAGVRTWLLRRSEGGWWDMLPTIGDFYVRKSLPFPAYDGPSYA